MTGGMQYDVGSIIFDDGVSPRTSPMTFNLGDYTSRLVIYNELKLSSGVVLTTSNGYGSLTFAGPAVKKLKSAGKYIPMNIYHSGVGGTLTLQDDANAATFSLTSGTIDLNNKLFQALLLISNNSNVRSIAFGQSGKFSLSASNDAPLQFDVITNFSFTGTSNIELTSTASSGTRAIRFGNFSTSNESQALNVTIKGGSDRIVTWNNSYPSIFRNLVFEDGFSGTWGDSAYSDRNLTHVAYGGLRLSPNMTFSLAANANLQFAGTSGVQELTSSGKTIPFFVTKSGASTLQLKDNVTVDSAKSFSLNAGLLSLNGKTLTTGSFSSAVVAVRSIAMESGAINLSGTGAVWNLTTPEFFTLTGSGKIILSDNSATARTFAGGGFQGYPALEIGGATGASTTTITGANGFARIESTKTVSSTLVLPNTTTKVGKFTAGGFTGALLTLARTGSSGQFTLESTGGKQQLDYVSVSNSVATPADSWYAYRSTDGGGNSGWSFTLNAAAGDRYWVGGSGNWSDASKWAIRSGGETVNAVPTSANSAYFDAGSDAGAAFTVTVDSNSSASKDLIVGDGSTVSELDQTMTLAGSASLNVAGSLYLPSTKFAATYGGALIMSATSPGKTVTMNGNVITNGTFTFNGAGGEWTLGSAIPSGSRTIGVLSIARGTLRTAGYNISVAQFYMIDQLGAVFYAESSQIYCSISFLLNSGSTVYAGTSTFTIGYSQFATNYNKASTSPAVFYNVVLTSTSILSGPATFNDLTFTAVGAGVTKTSISDTQTVLGTLRVSSGNSDVRNRRMLASANGATISAASVDIGAGVDFVGINASGASSPWNLANLYAGDCGGNSGIVFPAPKTVYWNLGGTQVWNANAWASTPSGTPAANNFPLPQDTAVVTEAGAAGTIVNNSNWNIGNLLFDDGVNPRVSAVTFDISSGMYLTGDLKLSSGVSLSSTQSVLFTGRRAQRLTSAGKLFLGALVIDSVSGTVTLQDDCSFASLFQFNSGTLDLNGKMLSATVFNSSYSTVRKIIFNGGKVQLTGGGARVMECSNLTNFSYTGEPEFESTYTGNLPRQFSAGPSSGALESSAFNLTITAGSGVVDFISGGSRSAFRNVKFLDGFTGGLGQSTQASGYGVMPIVYGDLTLPKNQTFYSNGADDRAWILASGSRAQTVRGGGALLHDLNVSSSGSASVSLGENVTFRNVTLTSGEMKLNDKVMTAGSFTSSNTNQRSLVFGSGRLLLNGTGTVWNMTTSTNATITPGTGKIELTDGSDAARTFIGGGLQTYPELEIGGLTGSSTTTITGANRFKRLSSSKEVAHTIVFPNALTQVDGWGVNGREGQLVTLARTGSSGKFQLRYTGSGYLLGRYLSISNSDASQTGRWYALYSTDGGNNTGWTFGPPKFGQFLSFFEI